MDMLHRQRPRELRLGVHHEAQALLSGAGLEAYAVARRRAQEASSNAIARDWSDVARVIARKMGNRPSSLLGAWLH